MHVEQRRIVWSVVVRWSALPRANYLLYEVSHGEQEKKDEDAGEPPCHPSHVVEEDVDGKLAAAYRRTRAAVTSDGWRATLLALGTPDFSAARGRLARGDQSPGQEGGEDARRLGETRHYTLNGQSRSSFLQTARVRESVRASLR